MCFVSGGYQVIRLSGCVSAGKLNIVTGFLYLFYPAQKNAEIVPENVHDTFNQMHILQLLSSYS